MPTAVPINVWPRAWALPRPADRAPFDIDFYSDDDTPQQGFPQAVALRLDPDADPPLDLPAIARLAAALCTFNRGPLGLELYPLDTMTQDELLAVLVAADPPVECRGRRRLGGGGDPPSRAHAVTTATLRAHVLALANAPIHGPTPP